MADICERPGFTRSIASLRKQGYKLYCVQCGEVYRDRSDVVGVCGGVRVSTGVKQASSTHKLAEV